jgi:hypothetical protein
MGIYNVCEIPPRGYRGSLNLPGSHSFVFKDAIEQSWAYGNMPLSTIFIPGIQLSNQDTAPVNLDRALAGNLFSSTDEQSDSLPSSV